jgi:hypothetical protein
MKKVLVIIRLGKSAEKSFGNHMVGKRDDGKSF